MSSSKMQISKPLEDILKSIQHKIRKAGKNSGIDESIASEMVYQYGPDLGIIGSRIWRIKENYIVLREQKGGRKKLKPGIKIGIDYGPVQEVLKSGFTFTNKDYTGYNKEIEGAIGSENSLAVRLSKRTILAIEVNDFRKARPALQLINIALDSSLRKKEFEYINELARKVERSLLPKEEDLRLIQKNYDVAWHAKAAKVVGGDYLRFRPMDDKSTAIMIGDAKGKGISASIVAQSTHIALETLTSHNLRAAALMDTINKTLYKTEITKEPMTLFYCTLTPHGAISYVNAGHPYPIIFHESYVEKLYTGGIMLGPLEDSKYSHDVAKMRTGDLLFLYTDGLSEATNPRGEEIGIKRLETIVGEYKRHTSGEIKEYLIREVKEYMGKGKFRDDVTFAVIKKR